MPTSEDFKVFIIQVKSGDRHPDTGIPPSFITIKCETLPGKSPQFFIDMGRPTKIYFSLERQKKVSSIIEKVWKKTFNSVLIYELTHIIINIDN